MEINGNDFNLMSVFIGAECVLFSIGTFYGRVVTTHFILFGQIIHEIFTEVKNQ